MYKSFMLFKAHVHTMLIYLNLIFRRVYNDKIDPRLISMLNLPQLKLRLYSTVYPVQCAMIMSHKSIIQ